MMWIIDRCEDKVDAVESPIGYLPKAEDLNLEGLEDVTLDTIRELLDVDRELWLEDVANVREFYAKIGDRVPKEFYTELDALEARLKN